MLCYSCHVFREAISHEFLFQGYAFGHKLNQFIAELRRPDVGVLGDEFREKILAQGNVIGFISERVLEHLTDPSHLVLSVKRKNHGKEGIELSSFHDLGDSEDGLRETLFVLGDLQVDTPFQFWKMSSDELVLSAYGRDVVESSSDFIDLNIQTADDVQE